MKFQKVTESSTDVAPQGAHGRWYGDACGTAFAMELIGERWSLMIIRELIFGPRRFSDLRMRLPGISAKVLTERLAGLEELGALKRERLSPPAGVQVYGLTSWGQAAEPAIIALGRWAAMHSGHDPTLPLSPVSLMLSMRTMFDPSKARGLQARIGFAVSGEEFVATVAEDALSIGRAHPQEGQVIIRAPDASAVAALLYGDVPASELETTAGLSITGDRALALRYAALFALPAKLT
jgi:DNA-binding HxlR family transcriptional regulator